MTHHHPCFGDLDLEKAEPVRWEQKRTVNGLPVEVTLWIESARQWNTDELDHFSVRLEQLDDLDLRCRSRLIDYLGEDDHYISFHMEEVGDSPVVAALVRQFGEKLKPAQFVPAMRMNNIGFWLYSDENQVIVDYMIDPEHSDEILAAKFTPDGEFIAIHWES